MAPTYLQLAADIVDAVARRDVSRLIELTDPDVEWRPFATGLLEEGVYRGHEGVRQYVRDLDDAWEMLRADVDDGLAVGTAVLLVGRLRYRGRGSGIETEHAAGWAIRFRDGRLVSMRAFRDPERLIEALATEGVPLGGT
jgi:ketosteroid isomerase-like protein